MARKIEKREAKDIEDIVIDSVKRVGLNLDKDKSALLMRLIASGIATYFFKTPDVHVDLGFLRFKKNPAKEELFAVEILKNGEEGVVNAPTLWKYYKGELAKEVELRGLLEGFANELITYSQIQEINTMNVTTKLNRRKK